MVDLVVSSEQQQIIDSVVDFLAAEMPLGRLRPGAPSRSDGDDWRQMGELGWFMLSLPEREGGLGLSAVEEALLFRELGRHLLTPNVLAAAIGARVAVHAGNRPLARAIASGAERVALANPIGSPVIGSRVSGRFHLMDAGGALWVLAIAEGGNAALLDAGTLDGVSPRASAVDGMTLAAVTLTGAPAVAVAGPDLGAHILLRLLSAAMLSGLCEGSRDLATDYAKMRVQFGQPIGAFQAIKHKCSDMMLRADAVSNLVNFAAIRVAGGASDAAFQATAAKVLSANYALLNAKEAIQVHGGIGFTTECDAHHFLKRAHVYDQIGGAMRRQQQLLLREPAPAPAEDSAA